MNLATFSANEESNLNLPAYLSALLMPPRRASRAQLSLVAVYHTDVAIATSASSYSPSPLSLLTYLATTIIRVHSFTHLFAEKTARERSLMTPVFGLDEGIEGVMTGLKPSIEGLQRSEAGLALELEHRRKSGRGVMEWFFLPVDNKSTATMTHGFRETAILLDDHPKFTKVVPSQISGEKLSSMTFELSLSQRQRQERDGVVLPYFDAQKVDGGGTGGRILYDMGIEDDFDEEEDEI